MRRRATWAVYPGPDVADFPATGCSCCTRWPASTGRGQARELALQCRQILVVQVVADQVHAQVPALRAPVGPLEQISVRTLGERFPSRRGSRGWPARSEPPASEAGFGLPPRSRGTGATVTGRPAPSSATTWPADRSKLDDVRPPAWHRFNLAQYLGARDVIMADSATKLHALVKADCACRHAKA